MAARIEEERPNQSTIRFLHYKARPHIARVARQTLLDFGWEVMPLLPHTDQSLCQQTPSFECRSLTPCKGALTDEDDSDRFLNNFFESKPEAVFTAGIRSLPENREER